jgi:hypothetical protein
MGIGGNGLFDRDARKVPGIALIALIALAICAAPAGAAPPVTIAKNGNRAAQVDEPKGTAVDHSDGDLYVADTANRRIDKFDPEGHFLEAWGSGVADGESAEPQSCGPQANRRRSATAGLSRARPRRGRYCRRAR